MNRKEICAFFATNPQPVPVSLAQTLASPSHQLSSASANLASMPNVQITALLSVSFRRLDKYPALLQELQRILKKIIQIVEIFNVPDFFIEKYLYALYA